VAGSFRIPRLWPGETIVCIAGGPSLTQVDVDHCRGRARVIAVNDAYRLAPWADVFYACDAAWWQVHGKKVMPLRGLKLTHSADATLNWDLKRVAGRALSGLSLDPAYIHLGNNGGYQALNLAVLFGAALVPLLGYDMQGRHWFGDHPKACRSPMNFQKWLKYFATVPPDLERAGVRVVNCSRETALECFPRSTIDQVLTAPALERET
jgi:hypothetical protein